MQPLDYETPDLDQIVVLKAKRRTIVACVSVLTAAGCLLAAFATDGLTGNYEDTANLCVLSLVLSLIGWISALMGVIQCRKGLRSGSDNRKLRIMLVICGVVFFVPLVAGAIVILYLLVRSVGIA